MNAQKCIPDADIGRLLDGDVTSHEKQSLHEHIETCPQCKARWQQASAGARRLDDLFTRTAKEVQTAGECLSGDLLTGFIDKILDSEKRRMVEDHLATCSSCRDALADKFTNAYTKSSDKWWSEYAAGQMLEMLAMVPDQADELFELLYITRTVESERATTIIKLPILEPAERQTGRLAAATGEGFSVQTLRQEEPAFEFELSQFGEQLRITASPIQIDSPYANCLARLKVLEKDVCRWTEFILIDKGEGKCVLAPEQTRKLRPKQAHLTLRLEPIVTLEQLAAAGTQAYMPILKRLLKHEDRKIRSAAIKVAARIYGLEAHSLIEPLADDEDEMVRETVKDALDQFPKS